MSGIADLKHVMANCTPERVASGAVGQLASVRGPLLIARGLRCPVGTAARVGDVSAEVIGFAGENTMLIGYDRVGDLQPGTRVQALGPATIAGVGNALLGRVIDAHGMPIDSAGSIPCVQWRDVRGHAGNPLARGAVREAFSTGVRAIDALMTLGRGQRVMLAAGSGVGKSTLIRQVIAGSQADVCIVALVGERNREIVDFVEATRGTTAAARTITVAVPGDRSPLLRIRAAERATAIAEWFRDQGKQVVLIVDSLTRVAHAQRELGLALGETPTMKGYPPSALALIPALLERCGNDAATGGSITAIYTVLADGDDVDDPVVDSARSIADGHIMLSRSLAEQGVFPAIDIGRSLSRIMADIAAPAHKAAAARVRRLWAVAEENRDLALMGAYRAGADPVVDEALEARGAILDFVAQGFDQPDDDAVACLIREFGA